MRNKKYTICRASADVANIDIGAYCADVTVAASDSDELYIEHSKSFALTLTERDGKICLHESKDPLWRLRHSEIIVHVPACIVPDMNIRIFSGSIKIESGMYNDVQLSGKFVKAEIFNSTFENLTVKADELDVCAGGITVKNLANALAADGRVEFDKTFCKKAECRVKKGNIGLCNSACDFAVLNSDEGNIAASVVGQESDYTISLKGARVCGTNNHSSSGKFIKARADRGSVVLDFYNAACLDEVFSELQA